VPHAAQCRLVTPAEDENDAGAPFVNSSWALWTLIQARTGAPLTFRHVRQWQIMLASGGAASR